MFINCMSTAFLSRALVTEDIWMRLRQAQQENDNLKPPKGDFTTNTELKES